MSQLPPISDAFNFGAPNAVLAEMGEVAKELGSYDGEDVLAAVAALQLVPTNAHRLIRLHALAHVAATLPRAAARAAISGSRLGQVLHSLPFSGGPIAQSEDPFEGPLVESVTFSGGGYRVIQGVTDEDAYVLARLCDAVFLHRDPFPDQGFARWVYAMTRSVLALSDEVCRRGGLGRGLMPPPWAATGIEVPARQLLQHLKRAVSFDASELGQVLTARGGSLRALEPLVSPPGTLRIPDYVVGQGPLLRTPIIGDTRRLTVAAPGMLCWALWNCVVRAAKVTGIADTLARRFHEAVVADVKRSLLTMGFVPLQVTMPPPPVLACFSELVLAFDADKLVYVPVWSDPLTRDDGTGAFGVWTDPSDMATVATRLRSVPTHLYRLPTGPNSVLALLAVQGLGGVTIFEDDHAEDPLADGTVMLPAVGLSRIAGAESQDPLALWKYARVRQHAEATVGLSAFGELDLFAFYRKYRHSFYCDDSLSPGSMLTVTPGFAHELHREDVDRYDRHAAPSFRPGRTMPVVLGYSTREVPLYVPDRPERQPPAVLFEDDDLRVWFVGPEAVDPPLFRPYFQFCDMFAYWLWQCGPTLNGALDPLRGVGGCVVVRLHLDPDQDWDALPPEPRTVPELGWIRVDVTASERVLDVHLRADVLGLLLGPSNRGERHLVEPVLAGLLQLSDAAVDNELVNAALAIHMPDGPKKKVVVLPGQAVPGLDTSGLPDFRGVQEPDVGMILDELGAYLRDRLNRHVPGPIPAEGRTQVLREAVGFLYGQLQRTVATLNPDRLLEWLVAHHEAAMARRANTRLTTPTRIACFGERLVEVVQQEAKAEARANLSGRFLIEYVAARPPSGIRPISMSVYDRMLALCDLIFDYGTESDLIHFGLADLPLSMLPSGRLGANREAFEPKRDAYFQALAGRQIDAAGIEFRRLWMERTAPAGEPPEDVVVLDAAALAEFGFTMTDISTFLAASADIAEGRPAAVEGVGDWCGRLSEELGWPPERVRRLLDDLSLFPRPDFLHPPVPFSRRDVEPWNFNRGMSYLRRPFLRRNDEVVYGYRQVLGAREYLLDLCLSGRLRASSQPMKSYVSRLQDERGAAFEAYVAEAIGRLPGFRVRRGLEKITHHGRKLQSPGDIDVLAADTRGRSLWVIECKDLATSRTAQEFANEMKLLVRGQGKERPTVEKHGARARWVSDNLAAVLEACGVATSNRWRVKPLIVIDTELMTPYLATTAIPIVTLKNLPSIVCSRPVAAR